MDGSPSGSSVPRLNLIRLVDFWELYFLTHKILSIACIEGMEALLNSDETLIVTFKDTNFFSFWFSFAEDLKLLLSS